MVYGCCPGAKGKKCKKTINKKYGDVTLCISAVQGEKAPALDIPPTPENLKLTP